MNIEDKVSKKRIGLRLKLRGYGIGNLGLINQRGHRDQ